VAQLSWLEGGVAEKNRKFMQSLSGDVYQELEGMAKERGITMQELIRAVVIPEWLRLANQANVPPSTE